MSELMDLKELEKRAYRSTFQDGLWDLYLAGIMATLGVLSYIGQIRDETWIWFIGYLVGFGGCWGLFMLGKKYITLPRLGRAKFGEKRKRRKMALVIILSASVLFNIVLLLLTMGIIKAPTWLDSFAGDMTHRGIMDILVPLFAGLFVSVIMCLIAWFIEFYRGMYIAMLFGLGIFVDMTFGLPVVLVIGAVIAAIPGLILFVRFIRQYPIQTGQVENGIR